MRTDSWRHLVVWELRFALRRSPFWLMLAAAALLPACVALLHHLADPRSKPCEPGWLIGAQVLTLSVMVAGWVVLSVKRQVAREVSDDWLLVINYRHALAARYVAGAAIGLLLTAASTAGACLAARTGGAAAQDTLAAAQPLVLLSLVQPLAAAALLVGASDFLLAPVATVLTVLLFATLVWSALPGVGLYWPAVLSLDSGGGLFQTWMWAAVPACLALMRFGWRHSEDFWQLVEERRRDGHHDASLGAIRGELNASVAPKTGARREHAAALRGWLARWGLEPPLRCDLSRYPACSLRWLAPLLAPEAGRRRRYAALGALGGAALACAAWSGGWARANSVTSFVAYALWWALAATTVLRALSSGSQLVAQEREQGTLESLLLTPVGLSHTLDTKLLVVMLQALPGWALLALGSKVGWLSLPTALVMLATVCAAFAGILIASLNASKLITLVAGPALAAVLYAGLSALGGPVVSPYQPEGLPVSLALVLIGLILAWQAVRTTAAGRLGRQAAHARG